MKLNESLNKKPAGLVCTLLVLFLFLGSAVANAATWYVDGPGGKGVVGDDSNTGNSLNKPFRTLAKANSVVKPGDTVLVRGGVYNEQIKPAVSGQPNKKITYRGFSGELPEVRGRSGNPVKINDRSYIVVDGFNLYSPVKTWGAVVRFDGHHNELRNSIINNPAVTPGQQESSRVSPHKGFGLVVSKSKFNIIEGNTITGWWQGLGAGSGAADLVVRNNVIAGNVHTQIAIGPRRGGKPDSELLRHLYEGNIIGGSLTSDAIQTEDGKQHNSPIPRYVNIRGIIIRDNTFYFNAENALDFKAGGDILVEGNTFAGTLGDNDGMGVRSSSTGNTIERGNTITVGSDRKSERVILRHNIFYDNSAGTGVGKEWKIYNNVFAANNRDANGPNSSFMVNPPGVIPRQTVPQVFKGISLGAGMVAMNNIVIDHKHAAMKIRASGNSDRMHVDHNLYANVYGSVDFVKGRNAEPGTETLDFNEWRAHMANFRNLTGKDANSFIDDPLFINVPRNGDAGFPLFNFQQADAYNPVYSPVLGFDDLERWFPYDFRLQADSPAIDRGGFLTTATNSGNHSRTLKVSDSKLFFDGYGIAGEEGDRIQIGSEPPVLISSINYGNNTITLAASRSWSRGDNVSLPYNGERPDIGAFEFTGDSGGEKNRRPKGTDDSAVTTENIAVMIDVLANDTDVDGDMLSILSFERGSNGNVSKRGNYLEYMPDINFNGNDSFIYTVSDGNGGRDMARVNVVVKKRDTSPSNAPVITPNQLFTVSEESRNSEFIGNIDYTGKTLTGSRIVSGNSSGAFKLVPVGPNYQKLRYVKPNNAKPGTYALGIVLIDENGQSKPETVKIVIEGAEGSSPPADKQAPVITLKGSNPITITQGNTFTDPGATAVDNKDGSVMVRSQGSVNNNKAGTYTIIYTATDQAGNNAVKTRTVNVISSGGGGGRVSITIDGKVSDWNDIRPIATASGNQQNLRSLKVTSDADKLYFLLEGQNIGANTQFHLNVDNNARTGYQDGNWKGTGIDYLIENNWLYKSQTDNASWSWGGGDSSAIVYERSSSVVEVSVKKSALAGLKGTIKVGVWNLSDSWSVISGLPDFKKPMVTY